MKYERQALEFHSDRPQVYRKLCQLCRSDMARGIRPNMRSLWERARIELKVIGMNDHFHSTYSRLMMAQEPDMKGIFVLRRPSTKRAA